MQKIDLTASKPRKVQQQHKKSKKKYKPFNSKKGRNQNQQSQGKEQQSGEEQMETEGQEDTDTAGTSGENSKARRNTSHQSKRFLSKFIYCVLLVFLTFIIVE